jgi:RNA polymerase sigma factor (sigma-70 family)
VVDRDEAAFEALVLRHGPMVMGVCRRVLLNPHDAEDAFQAAFLVLARKAPSIWVKGSLASWLYRIAIRIAVQSRSDAERRRRRESRAAESAGYREEEPVGLDPDLVPVLHEEIDRLPERYRAPVILCYLEELTHEAAAHVLQCPIGTVHGRLSRARELLRRRLTRRGVALPAGSLIGGRSLAAAVPESLRGTTLRAALNLAAGQSISTAVTSTKAGGLVATTLRAMMWSSLRSAAAMMVAVGLAISATSLIAGSPIGRLAPADDPAQSPPSAVSERPPRSDHEAIRGEWTVTSIEQVNHQPSDEEKRFWKTGQFTITVTADRLIFNVDRSEMKYRLDSSTTPRRMLWSKPDDPSGRVVAIAIYELKGDDLKICVGRNGDLIPLPQAPHGFDIKSAPAGTFPTLFVMKRKKEPALPEPAETLKSRPRQVRTAVPQDGGPMHSNFDGVTFERILSGAKDEPLFVDLDTGRYMAPPFALELVDAGRPLTLSNLAFPDQLKSWVLRHGIDAAVQTDGRTITLIGLEMEDGEPLPESTDRSALTPARALERIRRTQGRRPRRGRLDHWPRFVRRYELADHRQILLPFLTREGGLGFLYPLLDATIREGHSGDSIRLDYQIQRGLGERFDGIDWTASTLSRREPAILGDFAGFLIIVADEGKLILRQPGQPERIEIGQEKVVVWNGQSAAAGFSLMAARLMTGVLDLYGRRDQVTIFGRGKEATIRREGAKL